MNTQQDKNIDDMLGPSDHLQRAFNLIGRIPTINVYSLLQRKNREMDTVANIVYKYGSWDNALMCTFPDTYQQLRHTHQTISKDDILSILDELRKNYNSKPTKIPSNLNMRILNLFGSWNNGLREAGLPIKKIALRVGNKKKVSEDDIKAALNSARMEISGQLTTTKYINIRKEKYPWWPSHCSICRKYGGWEPALSNFNIPLLVEELPAEYSSEITDTVEKLKKILICRPFITRDDIPDSFNRKTIKIIKKFLNNDFVFLSSTKTADMLLKMALKNFPVATNSSAEKGRQFALMYADGLTLEQIGSSVSLSRERVRQYISNYFDELYYKKKSPNKLTVTILEISQKGFPAAESPLTEKGRQFALMYADGISLEQIGDSASLSRGDVRKYIYKYFHELCSKERASNKINTMIFKMTQKDFPVAANQLTEKGRQFALMYAKGLTVEQISTSVSLSREDVKQYISKYFYEINRNKKIPKNPYNTEAALDFNAEQYQYAADLGFPTVTPERFYTERKITIGRLGASRLQKGETLEDIARSLCISCSSLKVYINRYIYKVSKLNSDE